MSGAKHNRKSSPTPVADILGGVLDECGLAGRLSERQVLDSWPEVVGDKIAGHVNAVDIREGVLYLRSSHGAWRQEVTMLAPQIYTKFATLYGDDIVREIRWTRW